MAKIKKIKLGNTTYDICDAGAATKKYVDDGLSRKLNTVGGSITGNLEIAGNLTVGGTTTTEKAETLAVKDSVIVTNADGAALGATLSGIAIKKDGENTYGVMYDPSDDSVKLGLGTLDAENSFAFNESGTDGKAIATRADSSALTDGHLVSWDGTTNSLVDSGKKTDDFVEKVTTTSGSNLAYVSKNDGTQGMFAITTAPSGGAIAQRKQNGGALEVGTAVGDSDAMPKKQVKDGFVAKIETGEQTGDILYGRDASNNEKGFIIESTAHNTGSIVQRKSGGAVEVGTPVGVNDATNKKYVDDGFVAKTSTAGVVYGTDSSGVQKEVPYSALIVNSSIALRDKGGHINVATPVSVSHATTKAYVDGGFVPKKTSKTGTQIYAFDNNGLKDVHMSGGATESGLAYKDNGGVLAVGTPVDQNHATTKKYVDDSISNSKISAINLTKAITSASYDATKGILMSGTSELTLEDGTKKDATMNIDLPIIGGDCVDITKYDGDDRIYIELNAQAIVDTALGTSPVTLVVATGSSGIEYYDLGQLTPAAIAQYTGDTKLQAVTDDEEINDPDTDAVLVNKAYANKHYAPLLTTNNPSYPYFYTVYGNKAPTLTGGSIPHNPNTVAIRGVDSTLKVGTPVGQSDATTKAYVDAFQTITILGADE